MTHTKPPVGRPRDAEDVPIGTLVRTPLGLAAEVMGYRGFRRGRRTWLVCRYLHPTHKRYDRVQLLPELVTVMERGKS